jgi:hypothetical protein
VVESRRRAEFITPIPKPRKQKKSQKQEGFIFDEGKGLSSKAQQYDATSIINEVRNHIDTWRALPNPAQWRVTPETARLLHHWRHYSFSGVRPFFCQIEAIETAIWLTEVAPQSKTGSVCLTIWPIRQQGRQPRTDAAGTQIGDRRGQDHRDGHADRLADHQCRAPPQQQASSPAAS